MELSIIQQTWSSTIDVLDAITEKGSTSETQVTALSLINLLCDFKFFLVMKITITVMTKPDYLSECSQKHANIWNAMNLVAA